MPNNTNFYNPEKKHTPKTPDPNAVPIPTPAQQVRANGRRSALPAKVPAMEMHQEQNVEVYAGVRQQTGVPYAQIMVGTHFANVPAGDALMMANTMLQVATMAYVDSVLLQFFMAAMGMGQTIAWNSLEQFQSFRQQYAGQQEALQRAAGVETQIPGAEEVSSSD